MTAVHYPSSQSVVGGNIVTTAGPNLGTTYDVMGRPSTLTDLATSSAIISATTYGAANQLLTLSGQITETRSYNSLMQLTQLVSSNTSGGSLNISYGYSSTQNNGKITSQTDNLSGEQVVYTYDALNRLASAAATNNSWGQSYNYDGFGNLTDQTDQTVTAGSAPAYHVTYNAATNRQTTDCADANGNINSSAGACGATSYNYDVANRIVGSATANQWQYSYAPKNRRVWRGTWSGGTQTRDWIYFWGIDGQKLGTWALSTSGSQLIATNLETHSYFAGRMIQNVHGYVAADRLGSIGTFYPYGQEKPSATTDGTEKFTGYFRDLDTGNDYAINRYHIPGQGRFFTPDPAIKSVVLGSPGSWNRYGYVLGDPINQTDPTGLCTINGQTYADGAPPCPDVTTVIVNGDSSSVFPFPIITDGGCNDFWCNTAGQIASTLAGIAGIANSITQSLNSITTVNKDYAESMSCSKSASQVMNAVERNFGNFGNFGTPNVDFESVTYNPPAGQLTVGQLIPISVQVGYTQPAITAMAYTLNTSVNVTGVSDTSLTFQTVEGHLLYPASITFSAMDAGNGAITFDISINGQLPNLFNAAAFLLGGGAFEDSQWNHFLQKISALCNQ